MRGPDWDWGNQDGECVCVCVHEAGASTFVFPTKQPPFTFLCFISVLLQSVLPFPTDINIPTSHLIKRPNVPLSVCPYISSDSSESAPQMWLTV